MTKNIISAILSITLVLIGGGGGSATAADDGATAPADTAQKALIEGYVAAVNAHDLPKLKSLMHPKCRAAIADADHDFWDRAFAAELKESIPTGTELHITPVRPDQIAGMKGYATFPIEPTYQIQINWFPSTNHLRARAFFTVHEGDQWYLVEAIPTPETLQRFRTQQAPPAKPESGTGAAAPLAPARH